MSRKSSLIRWPSQGCLAATKEAAAAGLSLNDFILEAIREKVGGDPSLWERPDPQQANQDEIDRRLAD